MRGAGSRAFGAALALSAGTLCAASERPSPASAPVARLAISFKIDARLFGGTYGGERWVSGPTYSSAARLGEQVTVEAKVRGVDAGGRTVPISPDWVPADPDMVAVSSVSGGRLDHVRLTVKKLGESKLRVAWQGLSKELRVEARTAGTNAMQVTITQ